MASNVPTLSEEKGQDFLESQKERENEKEDSSGHGVVYIVHRKGAVLRNQKFGKAQPPFF